MLKVNLPKFKMPGWWHLTPMRLAVFFGGNAVACWFNLILTIAYKGSPLFVLLFIIHGVLASWYWRELRTIWNYYEEFFSAAKEPKDGV